jgi:hypothetical protein
MGLLYCLGWLGPARTLGLSKPWAPSGLALALGLPCGGLGSEASMCEEQTEVWEKEELKVSLSSRVPRLALALGLGLGAARLPFMSRAGSWHRAAPCRGERREWLEATCVQSFRMDLQQMC